MSEQLSKDQEVTRTDSEWIVAFRAGERVVNEFTWKNFTQPQCGSCMPRTIVCGTDPEGDDRDIVECARCGRQWETSCNFDEDMS